MVADTTNPSHSTQDNRDPATLPGVQALRVSFRPFPQLTPGGALGGPARAGAARQPGRPAGGGPAGLAGRGARAGRRPGGPYPHRIRSWLRRLSASRGWRAGGGAVGRRHERPRDRCGDGPRGKHDPLACEAHVRQTRAVAAGGAWCGLCCRWPALRSPGSEGGNSRGSPLTSVHLPSSFRYPAKKLPNLPNLGDARSARCAYARRGSGVRSSKFRVAALAHQDELCT